MKIRYEVVGTMTLRYSVLRTLDIKGSSAYQLGVFGSLRRAKRAIRKDIDNEMRRAEIQKTFAGKVFHEQEVTL